MHHTLQLYTNSNKIANNDAKNYVLDFFSQRTLSNSRILLKILKKYKKTEALISKTTYNEASSLTLDD